MPHACHVLTHPKEVFPAVKRFWGGTRSLWRINPVQGLHYSRVAHMSFLTADGSPWITIATWQNRECRWHDCTTCTIVCAMDHVISILIAIKPMSSIHRCRWNTSCHLWQDHATNKRTGQSNSAYDNQFFLSFFLFWDVIVGVGVWKVGGKGEGDYARIKIKKWSI